MDASITERREFLRDLARLGLLGGLGFVGALLVWRRWREGVCEDGSACRACGAYAACPLRRPKIEETS
jgi:hypothetical protein